MYLHHIFTHDDPDNPANPDNPDNPGELGIMRVRIYTGIDDMGVPTKTCTIGLNRAAQWCRTINTRLMKLEIFK